MKSGQEARDRRFGVNVGRTERSDLELGAAVSFLSADLVYFLFLFQKARFCKISRANSEESGWVQI